MSILKCPVYLHMFITTERGLSLTPCHPGVYAAANASNMQIIVVVSMLFGLHFCVPVPLFLPDPLSQGVFLSVHGHDLLLCVLSGCLLPADLAWPCVLRLTRIHLHEPAVPCRRLCHPSNVLRIEFH